MRRSGAGVVGTVLVGGMVAGALAGCGPSSPSSAPAPTSAGAPLGQVTTAADGTQEVTLQTGDDYVFTPDHFTVRPGTVRLTVRNVGRELTHNFLFPDGGGPAPIGPQIDLLPSGSSKTITFSVTTPGAYRFECSFHVDLGQVGTMTVGG